MDRVRADRQLASGRVPFELGVSEHSKVSVPRSREIVAQLEVRKPLSLLDNPGYRIPYFEPFDFLRHAFNL
jgi:hypothetical protein